MFNKFHSAYRVDLLTHGQARERLAERPAVILPLGGCEPFGGAGPVGIETLCAERVADELSIRGGILRTPAMPFGCSAPFMSFPGATGVKPRTMVNLLCEIIHAYVLQGVTRIFLVSAAPFNKKPAEEAVKRIEAKYGGVKVLFFDINTIAGIDNGIDRADAALLSLAAYLAPERINIGINTDKRKSVTADQYKTWKKRGADPQKLRKLFPDGLLLLDNDESINITPERGKELFDRIVSVIQEEIEKCFMC
ncbi:hypothetical protein R80B4_02089 [Fibrobacteres bacterium R8-0-B4]